MGIRKLEQRIMELESDLDTEARKADKRVKEVEFALDDERKASEKAHDGLEKMHSKMKNMRLGLKDAEAQVSALQTKYKKATLQLEEAEERCETAEGALPPTIPHANACRT